MAKQQSYADISQELEDVLAQMQADDIDVDAALALYERGSKLVDELEGRLKSAENKIRELKPSA